MEEVSDIMGIIGRDVLWQGLHLSDKINLADGATEELPDTQHRWNPFMPDYTVRCIPTPWYCWWGWTFIFSQGLCSGRVWVLHSRSVANLFCSVTNPFYNQGQQGRYTNQRPQNTGRFACSLLVNHACYGTGSSNHWYPHAYPLVTS